MSYLPTLLNQEDGIERIFECNPKIVKLRLEAFLPKSSPLKQSRFNGSNSQLYEDWIRRALTDTAARTSIFRGWMYGFQVPQEWRKMGGRKPENRGVNSKATEDPVTSSTWNDMLNFCAVGTPGMVLYRGVKHVEKNAFKSAANIRAILQNEAHQKMWSELLPSWACSADVLRSNSTLQLIALGLAATQGFMNGESLTEDDYADLGCFLWGCGVFLEDDRITKRALERWPDLKPWVEGEPEFHGEDVTQCQDRLIAPLLLSLGAVAECAQNTASWATSLCAADKAGLIGRSQMQSMLSVFKLIDRIGPLGEAIELKAKYCAIDESRFVLTMLVERLDNLASAQPYHKIKAIRDQSKSLIDAVTSKIDGLLALKYRDLLQFMNALGGWSSSVFGKCDDVVGAIKDKDKHEDKIREASKNPSENREMLRRCIDDLCRYEDDIKRRIDDLEKIVLEQPKLEDYLPQAQTNPIPVPQNTEQTAQDTPRRIDELKQELDIARDQLAVERDRLKAAGARIAELQSAGVPEPNKPSCVSTEDILSRLGGLHGITPREALAVAASNRLALRILPSAWESARQSKDFKYGAKLLTMLLRLGGEYASMIQSGLPDAQARNLFGTDGYKANESNTVMTCADCVRERTFEVDGKMVVMEKHLGIGTSPDRSETIRVHFEIIDGRVVVGHCGRHLLNPRKV